jgi:hypothetical protein
MDIKIDTKTENKKKQLEEDCATHYQILDKLILHIQLFLKWLIDIGLDSRSPCLN